MRKIQQDVKLDKDLRNIMRNYPIEMEKLDDDKSLGDYIEKDGEKEDEENINVPTADLYSHTVTMIQILWRK